MSITSRPGFRASTLLATLALALVAAAGKPVRQANVGMAARIDQIVIRGPELEARSQEDRQAPLVLRVLETYPHGPGAFRYDLEFQGLVPGIHDLRPYLRRKDGQAMEAGEKGPFIEVLSVLPPGQIEPRAPLAWRAGRLGGYRSLLVAAGIAWALGLAYLLWSGRRRGRAAEGLAQSRPPTLAERLGPLVERATRGELPPSELAELERLLLGHWSRRLKLGELPPAQVIGRLRGHEQAGPLVRQLELWLHAPASQEHAVDVAALLAPYRDLPEEPDLSAEALSAHGAGERAS